MAIRTFGKECWVCGWFNEDGSLRDVQQYETEEQARKSAQAFRNRYFTFIGKLERVEPDGSDIYVVINKDKSNRIEYVGTDYWKAKDMLRQEGYRILEIYQFGERVGYMSSDAVKEGIC